MDIIQSTSFKLETGDSNVAANDGTDNNNNNNNSDTGSTSNRKNYNILTHTFLFTVCPPLYSKKSKRFNMKLYI